MTLTDETAQIWAHKNVKGHTFEQAQNEVATRGIKYVAPYHADQKLIIVIGPT